MVIGMGKGGVCWAEMRESEGRREYMCRDKQAGCLDEWIGMVIGMEKVDEGRAEGRESICADK